MRSAWAEKCNRDGSSFKVDGKAGAGINTPFFFSLSATTCTNTPPQKDQHLNHQLPQTSTTASNQTTQLTTANMSSLTYTQPAGFVQNLTEKTHYSQAVRLPTNPPTVKISGQGPWDPDSTDGAITAPTNRSELYAQVDRAFSNVALTLQSAGSKGWEDVYLARMFYVVGAGEYGSEEWAKELEEVVDVAGEVLRKWCPGHRPLLTAVEVRGLAAPGMRVEVEVEAILKE